MSELDQSRNLDLSSLRPLCDFLRQQGSVLQRSGDWPARQLQACAEHDVFRWFVPSEFGGHSTTNRDVIGGYIKLASACLTTTFVISQRTAACRRIVASQNSELKDLLLPKLADGILFSTVGLSHLTTSHRHVGNPILTAQQTQDGWVLDGFCPWVTGAAQADYLVIGASVGEDQILLAVPGGADGVSFDPSFDLLALTASQTGKVKFENVFVSSDLVMAGPAAAVLAPSSTEKTATGGLQTSALAIGLATAAVEYLAEQKIDRPNLQSNANALENELKDLTSTILAIADGEAPVSREQLRKSANDLVIRSTQSALIAAKGAGFVADHPVGRWCQEALFFLVWSCPQAVSDANLCELAGIDSEI